MSQSSASAPAVTLPRPSPGAAGSPQRRAPLRLIAPLAVLVSFLLMMLLSGCSAPGLAAGGPEGPDVMDVTAPDEGAPNEAAPNETAPVDPSERLVARSAWISLNVTDPLVGADAVAGVTTHRGGWVSSENIVLAGSGSTHSVATVTITVPAHEFEATLDDLADLGILESRQVTTEDVTDQVVDLEARIASKRASIQRISDLMDRAGSVGDIARVESELASRQAELESMLAQQKYFASITEQSTITVELTSPVSSGPNPLWTGLQEGWAALQSSVRVLLVLIGALTPFVLTLVVVAVPLLWWLRRRRALRSGAGIPEPVRPAPVTSGAAANDASVATDEAPTEAPGPPETSEESTPSPEDSTVSSEGK